jgi:hypothetical protein
MSGSPTKFDAWIMVVIGLPLFVVGGYVVAMFWSTGNPDESRVAIAILTAFIWMPALLALVAGAILLSLGIRAFIVISKAKKRARDIGMKGL